MLGVRASSEVLGDLLAAAFSDRLVADADPPGNLSVYLGAPGADGVRPLHRLYDTYARTLRTRSVTRLMDAVWHELDSRDTRLGSDALLLDVAAVVQDERVHLLPSSWRRVLVDDARRWSRDGLMVVDRRIVELDVVTASVRIPASGFAWPAGTYERLLATSVEDRPEPVQPAGEFPIASWTTDSRAVRPAVRLTQAATRVADRDHRLNVTRLRGLGGLLGRVPPLPAVWGTWDELREQLATWEVSQASSAS